MNIKDRAIVKSDAHASQVKAVGDAMHCGFATDICLRNSCASRLSTSAVALFIGTLCTIALSIGTLCAASTLIAIAIRACNDDLILVSRQILRLIGFTSLLSQCAAESLQVIERAVHQAVINQLNIGVICLGKASLQIEDINLFDGSTHFQRVADGEIALCHQLSV